MSDFPAPPRLHTMHVPGADPDRDAVVARQAEQGDLCLHEDPERRGLMVTWLEALACAVRHDDPWAVILSDDAEPLPGWQQHLERACLNSPHPFLGLTHFGGYGEKALTRGVPYAEGPYLLWGGAVAIHRSVLGGLRVFASQVFEETGYPHDDVITCAYAMKTGNQVAMAARAIFDQPVQRSLLGHNTPIRRPATTIANTDGPSYKVRPKAVRVSRGISPKGELERLAAL